MLRSATSEHLKTNQTLHLISFIIDGATRVRSEKCPEEKSITPLATEKTFAKALLTKSFEATRGLFETDLVIVNGEQMTRTTPELTPPSPSFRATPAGGRLPATLDFAFTRSTHRADFHWNRVSNLEPSCPKPRPYHKDTAGS
ncbi:hypothetical protein AVEN_30708-1 [Araneus ventricosus]|uniref:Uncharacterized protein n=1 Tax=Araneus ventricosus TaxID=182803 RepID=A0A4Y2IZ63_ARAVE|nr:hypothetical protein AVEN_30708-1 [Araneus ventricosus]